MQDVNLLPVLGEILHFFSLCKGLWRQGKLSLEENHRKQDYRKHNVVIASVAGKILCVRNTVDEMASIQ